MAKKSESNTGLIVTLVIFVLLSITLGVFTYLGYAGQADLEKKAKDATAEQQKTKGERDQEMLKGAVLRTAIGIPSKDDGTTIGALRKEKEAVLTEQIRAVNDVFGPLWDPAKGDAPTATLQALVTSLKDQASRAQAAQKTAEDALAAANAEHQKEIARLTAALQTADAAKKKAMDDLNAEKQRQADAFTQAIADLGQKQGEKENVIKQSDVDVTGLKRELAKKNEEIAQLKAAKEKLEADRRTMDLIGYDQPKGRIESVDRANGLVYINIGSADYVRPQLTFSVLPVEATGKGALDVKRKKASIEVVQVRGAHLSVAKVTELTSTRDPLVTGDLLFNPAWSPNVREHVAVVGLVDLNGDGQDDTLDFVRNLERQGVVVDLYLDLKDLSTHGPGMTYQTSYLVMGERPQVSGDRQGDRLTDRKNAIKARIDELELQAKGMGIQVISARKFMAMIGYPLPRTTVEPNFAAGAGLLSGPAAAPPVGGEQPMGEKPAPTPPPAPEKKQ